MIYPQCTVQSVEHRWNGDYATMLNGQNIPDDISASVQNARK